VEGAHQAEGIAIPCNHHLRHDAAAASAPGVLGACLLRHVNDHFQPFTRQYSGSGVTLNCARERNCVAGGGLGSFGLEEEAARHDLRAYKCGDVVGVLILKRLSRRGLMY
jgi:hypothetical protein